MQGFALALGKVYGLRNETKNNTKNLVEKEATLA